jgi:hypothetical protein
MIWVQAAERVDARPHHRPYLRLIRDVGLHRDGASARPRDLGGGGFDALRGHVRGHDLSALPRKRQRRQPPHPAAGAGDQRHFARQPHPILLV